MTTHLPEISFHQYVDEKLSENGYKITAITEKIMNSRLDDFMSFVNQIRSEYSRIYDWQVESREYFLNGLADKWKYSFTITDMNDNICFVNFSSVYNDIIHNHCTYSGSNYRNLGFAKLHMIKLCQTGLDNGFSWQEGYWPVTNNSSIVLFLKMGWQIDKVIEEKGYLLMKANLEIVRDKTFNLLNSSNLKK